MARDDEGGNVVLSPRCVRLGAGKRGEIMKLIGTIAIIALFLWLFVNFTHAQDLFDRAEIEFDIDYIDIDKVKLLGSKSKGQVMAIWMKSGSVLTKTLLKSKIKNNNSNDSGYFYPGYGENEVYTYEDDEEIPHNLFVTTLDKSDDELIVMANDIINSTTKWTHNFRWSTSYKEEMDLSKILNALYYKDSKGSKFVNIGIDIISSELEHGVEAVSLLSEKRSLLSFAKGDEELTKQANEFLENNGFNKEKE